jgi:two-component system sensor histidine kinase/response regulator
MPRVMIVEDDMTILSNLSQLLQLSGLDVVEAHDGRMALDLLLAASSIPGALPRMIVSDLMMPNMDGFELLHAVRNTAELHALPFVLLSARSDASDLQHAFSLGASDYLIKPFEVDQLIDVIRYQMSQVHHQEAKGPGKDVKAATDFFLE